MKLLRINPTGLLIISWIFLKLLDASVLISSINQIHFQHIKYNNLPFREYRKLLLLSPMNLLQIIFYRYCLFKFLEFQQ